MTAKTNDLYVRMCEKHPIQKEWKPRLHDRTDEGIIIDIDSADDGVVIQNENYETFTPALFNKTYLPRQEDWQEKSPFGYVRQFWDWFEDEYEEMQYKTRISVSDYWTILWCLFVSKEVYNLEWNWEKNVWRKR